MLVFFETHIFKFLYKTYQSNIDCNLVFNNFVTCVLVQLLSFKIIIVTLIWNVIMLFISFWILSQTFKNHIRLERSNDIKLKGFTYGLFSLHQHSQSLLFCVVVYKNDFIDPLFSCIFSFIFLGGSFSD